MCATTPYLNLPLRTLAQALGETLAHHYCAAPSTLFTHMTDAQRLECADAFFKTRAAYRRKA